MPLIAGIEQQTDCGPRYLPSKKHRGKPSQHKSTWTFSVEAELACFCQAWSHEWGSKNGNLWGHRSTGGKLECLGSSLGQNGHKRDLCLAKFVKSSYNSPWHGYPADHVAKHQDRPPQPLLRRWMEDDLLSKKQFSRIVRGRPCS